MGKQRLGKVRPPAPGPLSFWAQAYDHSASLPLPSQATPAIRQRTGRPHPNTLLAGRLVPLRWDLGEGEAHPSESWWRRQGQSPPASLPAPPPDPGASPVPTHRDTPHHCSLPAPSWLESLWGHPPLTDAFSPFPELNFVTQSPEAARHGPHFPNPDAFHLTRRRGVVSWRLGFCGSWGWGRPGRIALV